MQFRFAARVIAQLGAELISSDEIALYELVKNGFDAGSDTVCVNIRYVLPISEIRRLQEHATHLLAQGTPVADVQRAIVEACLRTTEPQAAGGEQSALTPEDLSALASRVTSAATPADFVRAIGAVNVIRVLDQGHGMTQQRLGSDFLTIGTTFRYQQHQAHAETGDEYPTGSTPAGEKGIGRLSAMRLGDDLRIHTWVKNEAAEHALTIDWRLFNAESTQAANEIPVQYERLTRTQSPSSCGTVLTICDLRAPWSRQKAEEISQKSLARFIDPFNPGRSRQVIVLWNGDALAIPLVGRRFLDEAHNGMRGSLAINEEGMFQLKIDYWFTVPASGARQQFQRIYTSADFDRLTDPQVAAVGPFEFELYHYNRKRLSAIPGVASRTEFKEWLDAWCGGLMLYRDGLRVMPYGQMPEDDWLGLDESALRGKGFRVNRIQVLGCVRISRGHNPYLQDQTNREGLIDAPPTRTFQRLMRRIVQELFVRELERVLRAEVDTAESLVERSAQAQSEFEEAFEQLTQAAARNDPVALAAAREVLGHSLTGLRRINEDVERALATRELQKTELLELAATGLSAESLAHDLEANLDHAMKETVTIASSASLAPPTLRSSLEHLSAVFRSLRVQLAAIKPGPAKLRRRQTEINLRALLSQVVSFYAPRLDRHRISLTMRGEPPDAAFRIKAVEGHVRQIIDNLMRNSIYWLVDTRAKYPDAPPSELWIFLDRRTKCMLFADSGVGIAQEDTEWIFEAFNTHREGGHGLGLYIVRELGSFNAIRITVDSHHRNRWNRHGQFIVDFSQCFCEE